ncbi:MAG TPA: chromate transporter [Stellaceae bacterium]|jgi:chromate transporter|nr:chromate transporter [Stellaceae bacterium]
MWALPISLFLIFLPMSLVTIGGGYGIIGEMQRQVVDVHHWMTTQQYLEAFALSRATPGPGSLMVTFIGWQVAGLMGALFATLGIYAPASLITFGVANIWRRYRGARWQKALEVGLRPVAAGLVLATVYILLLTINGGWLARAIALVATALLVTTRINPLVLLISGAAIFTLGRFFLPV